MQDSLASFAKILDLFACLERTPTLFLHFFPRSWKDVQYLAKFAKINCHDDGKKNQKSKKFLHKKTKTPSTGDWSCLRLLLLRFLSCSLEEKSPILVFITKTCKNDISHWFHFAPNLRHGKQNLLLKSLCVFTSCLPSELLYTSNVGWSSVWEFF